MFSKKHTFTYTTEIQTTPETLFEFHSDTNNLPKITPPWIKVKILELKLPLEEKSTIKLKITQYFISQIWHMQIDKMQSPHTICDIALKSPFKSFYHHRKFEKIDETTSRLTDTITMELPLYPLSRIALPFIRRDMDRMFEYRHRRMKELLK
jgi:ligand-binding SRPBCC domain-containing protein